jgi:2-dehydro-3-deoxyphosphogluconate aldolase/(4S)-4-hydroxy-2-oxoglutarate aldolase
VTNAVDLRDGEVARAIRRHRLIVVLRRVEPQTRLLALADELVEAGARAFEVTMDSASGADDLAALRSHLRRRAGGPFLIGAGTVLGSERLEVARRAGADFAVAPILDVDLVRAAAEQGIPFIPGALTPTEISTAWAAGATFVKLFPASAVGPALIRELRGPLPEIAIIPTGGVDATNAAAYLAAGAAAVGIGGAILRADAQARRAIVAAVAGA